MRLPQARRQTIVSCALPQATNHSLDLPENISLSINHLPLLPGLNRRRPCSSESEEVLSVRSDRHLTPAQERVLALLAAGSTATAAARLAGIHRNTIGNWLRSSAFREALVEARRDQALAWREQTGALTSQAVGAIQAILADPQAPAAVRLQAALAMRGPQTARPPAPQLAVRPGRNQPCPCGSGRKFKRCCGSVR